ncbi:glutamine amidotransferase [Desulfovibrio sulfodismutans]|uniref:Glutamine amidotransferase n=1 Tax=Desulfolutivibrio sulfodismutans TaxID=63561 RepID=A0A7K3NIV2_9BACT|nr:gamma-glutamyl-gamma-aminobutyrate hydrolase family protein [Desulfolutivibrio sulfodismutans]NDY56124.1 glutamine amidotransferase [Desulfolutivibrio sulfodismutans]QLA13177.1 glutamine amidotransferase [Desulfolutivibrio sulfodismutans DSM 3696]
MNLRLALTMRVTQAPNYPEWRDCLAQDWSTFLASALPGAAWCAVPNVGAEAVAMLEALGTNALILTGGDDWGVHPVRDATEEALFRWALAKGVPVLGVCRGAQAINLLCGGTLARTVDRTHVAVRHAVLSAGKSALAEVNSFHNLTITGDGLGEGLAGSVWAPDDTVEAFHLTNGRAVGVMWHPEREPAPAVHDLALLQELFAEELQ